jgi:hypothetical protein
VKKAYPLETTQQSNAYKEQVKVTLHLPRKKALSSSLVLEFNYRKSLRLRPFPIIYPFIAKIMMD